MGKIRLCLFGMKYILHTLFFYDKIFLSDEERVTVRLYSSYPLNHDINESSVQEIQTNTTGSHKLASWYA